MAADIRWLCAFGVLLMGTTALGDGVRLGAAPGSTPRSMVVVELFTSEGCSSCPPAADVLSQLAHRQPVAGVGVLPPGEHVDYWGRLGWRGPLSSPAVRARPSTHFRPVLHTQQGLTPPHSH